MTSAMAERRRARRLLTVVTALAVVAVAIGIALGLALHQRSVSPDTSRAKPVDGGGRDAGWPLVAGFEVPVSRVDGPRRSTEGFSRTVNGAALAAVNVVVRTSASVGPATYVPTITRQVIGANASAMKALTDNTYRQLRSAAGVADGAPVPSAGEAAGYRVIRYAPDGTSAEVSVFIRSTGAAQDQVVRLDVQLQWSGGDWRVVAPPNGDWQSVATTVDALPAGTRHYEDVA